MRFNFRRSLGALAAAGTLVAALAACSSAPEPLTAPVPSGVATAQVDPTAGINRDAAVQTANRSTTANADASEAFGLKAQVMGDCKSGLQLQASGFPATANGSYGHVLAQLFGPDHKLYGAPSAGLLLQVDAGGGLSTWKWTCGKDPKGDYQLRLTVLDGSLQPVIATDAQGKPYVSADGKSLVQKALVVPMKIS